jgi:hypothetical protein
MPLAFAVVSVTSDALAAVVTVGGSCAKLALAVLPASIVTLQAPVPEHAPDQPTKAECAAGVAVSTTVVPSS